MKGAPDIIATVRFLSRGEGGRESSTPPEVFRCMFGYEDELFDCGLLLKGIGSLAPGRTERVPIQFLWPEYVKPRLRPGSRFILREAHKIAEGIVEEIIPG